MYSAILCGNHWLRMRPRSMRKMASGVWLSAPIGFSRMYTARIQDKIRTLATESWNIFEQADDNTLVFGSQMIGLYANLYKRNGVAAYIAVKRLRQSSQARQTCRRPGCQWGRHYGHRE